MLGILSPPEEIRSFIDVKVARDSMAYTDYVDPNDFEGAAKSNIMVLPDGDVTFHPALIFQEEAFEKSLSAYGDELTSQQKQAARDNREIFRVSAAAETDKRLQELEEDSDTLIEGWTKFRDAERDKGVEMADIVESYLADEDNFQEFKIRSQGIGASLLDSVAGLLMAIPALAGSESAKNYFVNYAKESAKRREIANLFGQDLGFIQDVSEAAAPMIVDVVATGVLSAFTGGVGGAAYLAVRTGSRASVKSLTRAVVSGALKETAENTTDKIIAKQIADGIFSGTGGKGIKMSYEEAFSIIKGYNKASAGTSLYGKLVRSPGLFIPAANRQSGRAYSSTYSALGRADRPLKQGRSIPPKKSGR